MTSMKLNGIDIAMELDAIESMESDEGTNIRWRNGTVTLPDGRQFAGGGGWIHSTETANQENERQGLQTTQYPEMYWPGELSEGDFEAYGWADIGDIDDLMEAVGMDSDDRDQREIALEVLQCLSAEAYEMIRAKEKSRR